MKRNILLTLIFFWFNFVFSQGYEPITLESVENIEDYSKEGFGFAGDIPSKSSLEKYVPIIGNQGQTGSCVAWATTYYNLSITYNSIFNITNEAEKFMHSFDPWFTFTSLNKSGNCMGSVHPVAAMEFIRDYGAKKLMLPPYDLECNQEIPVSTLDKMTRYLNPYRIKKFEKVMAHKLDPYNYPMDDELVNNIKYEIATYSFPVSAGFRNYGSSLGNVGSSGNWYPSYVAKSGGHFMTIIAYDDYKNGGSFKLVNNWGYKWGDNGYAWIRYSDFKKFCDIALFTWVNSDITRKSFNQITNIPNYTRMKMSNGNTIYEGETYQSELGGYGILSFRENNSHYAGWFKNGKFNGYFRAILDNKYQALRIENNKIISREDFGFAQGQENLEEIKKLNDYVSNMFPSIRFEEYDDEAEEVIIE